MSSTSIASGPAEHALAPPGALRVVDRRGRLGDLLPRRVGELVGGVHRRRGRALRRGVRVGQRRDGASDQRAARALRHRDGRRVHARCAVDGHGRGAVRVGRPARRARALRQDVAAQHRLVPRRVRAGIRRAHLARSVMDRALTKTRGGFLSRLFARKAEEPITPEFLDELEEGLLRADLSVSLVDPLMAQVRDLFTTGTLKTVPKALDAVRDVLVAELASKDPMLRRAPAAPRVILVVGVNGSGKTTTAAKLAKRLKDAGETPPLAAADTFRAAAIEQLETRAARIDVP